MFVKESLTQRLESDKAILVCVAVQLTKGWYQRLLLNYTWGGCHGGGEELGNDIVDKVEDDNCQKQEKEILAGLVQGLQIVRSDGDY